MKPAYWRVPQRRTKGEIAAHRDAILRLCDGSRTVSEIADAVGRAHGDVYTDILTLRRTGHRMPVRLRGSKGRAAVYRHFDGDGRLLYVGCTLNPIQRTIHHSTQAKWFERIAHITIEWFDSSSDALEAERSAIRDEGPLFNGKGNRPQPVTDPASIGAST